jgi:hypothetical protein
MKRSSRWRRRLAGLLWLILAVLVLAGLSALVIRFAPPWLVSTKGLSGSARLEELNRVRVALVVLLGALAGAVALYLLRSSNRERREETRERELIERFTRAIDQLGHPALDVRLGGIYSLERLAREWPENHPPIVEILAAYVREHAQLPARANGRREARRRPGTDVQASLTVLGRRVLAYDNDAPVGLAHTALAGATLTGAHLERAQLSGSNLEDADLFKAHLNAADLEWEGEVGEAVHPAAGPETYAAREAHAAPEAQPEWPPVPAPGWPHSRTTRRRTKHRNSPSPSHSRRPGGRTGRTTNPTGTTSNAC